ncbi:hypothetical protein ACRAWF_34870, partial [Streptomyces sp. L7]
RRTTSSRSGSRRRNSWAGRLVPRAELTEYLPGSLGAPRHGRRRLDVLWRRARELRNAGGTGGGWS